MNVKSFGLVVLAALIGGAAVMSLYEPGSMAFADNLVVADNQDQQEPKTDPKTVFMKQKLNHSKDIVAGLADEKFELIAKSAQSLMLLSQEADWKVLTTREYLQMSNEFRGSASRLLKTAEAKNLDGSTLAYFEVMLNCVRCHKYLRNHGRQNK